MRLLGKPLKTLLWATWGIRSQSTPPPDSFPVSGGAVGTIDPARSVPKAVQSRARGPLGRP